jgi:hypothetical protein
MAFNTSLICKINARKAVKRLISFVTASSMLFSGIANNIDNSKISAATTETTAKIYGDVTKDGKLDILDSISLTNYVLNSNKPISSNFDVSAADLDGDGVVNTIDVILMKYFITNSIDIFPIEATVDSDGDGLSDYIEKNITKTDPKLKDTDSDGLSDGEEIMITNTDPLLKDTDSNGINDGDEDPDKDGLKNIDEIKHKTNPLVEDTDEDGLNDGDEINKHKTNPLVDDTDEDGMDDYEEIILGLNPLNKASKGVADNLYTLEQTVKADNEIFKDINKAGSPYSFSATGKVAGLMERRLLVNKSGYTNVLQSDSIVGDILDISYDENVKMENMSIQFKVENGNCKDYYIFKYNQEVNMLLPFDVEYNEEEKIIYSPNIEIGTYALVDVVKFSEDMGLNESSEEIILSKDNVLATTEDVPDNIISYKPIDLVFALHSRAFDRSDYDGNIKSIKSISEHVLSCMPNARIAIVDYNEHQEYSTNAWIGGCKYLTNNEGYVWATTNDDVEQMLAQSKVIISSSANWYYTRYLQAYAKIDALDYRTSTNRYVVSLKWGLISSRYGADVASLSNSGYKVIDVSTRYWEQGSEEYGAEHDETIIQNGGIVKKMLYLGLVDLEEVKTYITGRYASGMFGESVKLKRKLTVEDFEVYNKWVSGAISRSDFSKYNLIDSDGDGLYDIEEIDMRFVRMENGVVYLPTIMHLINKTSNATYWSKFSGAMKNQGKNISNLEKKQVITYISKPDKEDSDGDYYPDSIDREITKHNPTLLFDEDIDDSNSIKGENPPLQTTNYTNGTLKTIPVDTGAPDLKNAYSFTRYSKPNNMISYLNVFEITPKENCDYSISISNANPQSFSIKVMGKKKGYKSKLIDEIEKSNSSNNTLTTYYSLKAGVTYTVFIENISEYNYSVQTHEVTISQNNWAYAPNGGVAYERMLEESSFSAIMDYCELYLTKDIVFNKIIETMKSDEVIMKSPKFKPDFIRNMEDRFFPLNIIDDNLVKSSGVVSTGATYAGVVLLVPGSQVLGIVVTLAGAGATTLSFAIGGNYLKPGFRESLAKAIDDDNYNLVYTTGLCGSHFGGAWNNNSIALPTKEWEKWDAKYISKYKYNQRLDVQKGLDTKDFSQYIK